MKRILCASLLLSSLQGFAAASQSSFEWDTRQWALKVSGTDERLMSSLKSLSVLSWCFEGMNGRGLLKDLTLHLAWDEGRPRLGLSKKEFTRSPEDAGIISCLDASLKQFPPLHSLEADEINFQYTIKRRR